MLFNRTFRLLLQVHRRLRSVDWQLERMERTMSAAFDRLVREVQETKDAAQAAATLLATLSQNMRDNAGDEDAINQLADTLDQTQQQLAAAVTANTPADSGAVTTAPPASPVDVGPEPLSPEPDDGTTGDDSMQEDDDSSE